MALNSLSQLRRLGPRLGGPASSACGSTPGFRWSPTPLQPLPAPLQAGCSDRRIAAQLRRVRPARRSRRAPFPLELRLRQTSTRCSAPCGTSRTGPGRLARSQLDWINLGGGYLLDAGRATEPLVEAVDPSCAVGHGLEVFIEPGAALRAGGGIPGRRGDRPVPLAGASRVAVLDTTVNHCPEIFEYQFEPDVAGHDDDGEYEYLLAGSTCLAGDVMGEYAFARAPAGRLARRADRTSGPIRWSRPTCSTGSISRRSILSPPKARLGPAPAVYLPRLCLSGPGLVAMRLYEREWTIRRARRASRTCSTSSPRRLRRQLAARRVPRPVRRLRDRAAGGYHCEVGILATGADAPPRPRARSRRSSSSASGRRGADSFNVVLLVPTGVNATLGGHAGDAGPVARLVASVCDTLITHPNVVNGSDINEMPENALYVEGSVICRLLMGTAGLQRVRSNRVLLVIDRHEEVAYTNAAINAAERRAGLLRLRVPADRRARPAASSWSPSTPDRAGPPAGSTTCRVFLDAIDPYLGEYDAVAVSSVIGVPPEFHQDYFDSDGEHGQPLGGRRGDLHARRVAPPRDPLGALADDRVGRGRGRRPGGRRPADGRRGGLADVPAVDPQGVAAQPADRRPIPRRCNHPRS